MTGDEARNFASSVCRGYCPQLQRRINRIRYHGAQTFTRKFLSPRPSAGTPPWLGAAATAPPDFRFRGCLGDFRLRDLCALGPVRAGAGRIFAACW